MAVDQVHAQHDAERRADRDQQLGAPEQLPRQRGQRQDGRPSPAEAGFEGIDEGRELEPAHPAREEDAAEDQAHAEAETALDPDGQARLVRSFDRAQQVAAVHPGRGHRQHGEPQRHGPTGDEQSGGRAAARLARRDDANAEEGAVENQHPDDSHQEAQSDAAPVASQLSSRAVGCDCQRPAAAAPPRHATRNMAWLRRRERALERGPLDRARVRPS